MERVVTRSAEETQAVGSRLGRRLLPGAVVCLYGDLGAGKTCLVGGLVEGFGNISPRTVSSPTYSILNVYGDSRPVYHFDLYRLKGSEDFLLMGFDEYFDGQGVVCVEWSERIADLIPPNAVIVRLFHQGNDQREVTIEGLPVE